MELVDYFLIATNKSENKNVKYFLCKRLSEVKGIPYDSDVNKDMKFDFLSSSDRRKKIPIARWLEDEVYDSMLSKYIALGASVISFKEDGDFYCEEH